MRNVLDRGDGRLAVVRPEAVHVQPGEGGTVLAAERRGPVVLLTVRRDDGVELEAATTALDPPRARRARAGRARRGRRGRRPACRCDVVIRRRVVVHGRVQGVWFRESARRLAERHAVTGWVRNRSDGAVEAVLEGAEEDVDRLVEFCRTGPSGPWSIASRSRPSHPRASPASES